MHILIIDDDQDVRELLAIIVGAEGHVVESAADGLDALERLRAGNLPTVILLDMMMPRLHGEGFLEAMKSDPHLSGIPVVIISRHQAARSEAARLGVAGCLVKPIELDDLLEVTERVGSAHLLATRDREQRSLEQDSE